MKYWTLKSDRLIGTGICCLQTVLHNLCFAEHFHVFQVTICGVRNWLTGHTVQCRIESVNEGEVEDAMGGREAGEILARTLNK